MTYSLHGAEAKGSELVAKFSSSTFLPYMSCKIRIFSPLFIVRQLITTFGYFLRRLVYALASTFHPSAPFKFSGRNFCHLATVLATEDPETGPAEGGGRGRVR
jgi:hypothetical protein